MIEVVLAANIVVTVAERTLLKFYDFIKSNQFTTDLQYLNFYNFIKFNYFTAEPQYLNFYDFIESNQFKAGPCMFGLKLLQHASWIERKLALV